MENNKLQNHLTKSKNKLYVQHVVWVIPTLCILLVCCTFQYPLFTIGDTINAWFRMREAPAAEERFKEVKNEIFSIMPHDSFQQVIPEHTGVLDYAPNCLQVEAKWIFSSTSSLSQVLDAYSKSKMFSNWTYSEGRLGSYHDHKYLSSDSKMAIILTIESKNSMILYETWLLYLSPSYSSCMG